MAYRTVLHSKIHRARVTSCDIDYEGSICIAPELMKAADICEYEKVAVFDVTNANRFETYAIKGEKGEIKVNGAAARLVKKGDIVIIVTYAIIAENEKDSVKPTIIRVDAKNRII